MSISKLFLAPALVFDCHQFQKWRNYYNFYLRFSASNNTKS